MKGTTGTQYNESVSPDSLLRKAAVHEEDNFRDTTLPSTVSFCSTKCRWRGVEAGY